MEPILQNKSTDRHPVASGKFYSSDKEALKKDISGLFESIDKRYSDRKVRAIISPHAGYVFSGKIAAAAFSVVPENTTIKNIFIIGSSHIMSFDGASVYNAGDYITPFGKATVNKEIADKLKSENKVFNFPGTAHLQEHSIEVQIPFIQYYFKSNPLIVPIIIGTNNEQTVKKIAEALEPWFTSENLFVISSDFSHYPSYKDAVETDKLTANSLSSGDPINFLNRLKKNSEMKIPGLLTSMCGWTAGLTLLYLAENHSNLKFEHIDYCNSGDSQYGAKNEVVGYHAIALFEEKSREDEVRTKPETELFFTDEEKAFILSLAKNTIRSVLFDNKKSVPEEKSVPLKLKNSLGAFVTLKINGSLRGCIGQFTSSDPLYKVVESAALSSAFSDPRFSPLTKDEFEKTEIEITVLGPLRKINNISEIILGKHGIYIKKDFRSGTMLPQVAIENGWSVTQFLGYTSRDKAGIGWDGWKDADLFIYEGVVLEENKK